MTEPKCRHLFIGDSEIARCTVPVEFMEPVWQVVDFYSSPARYEETAAHVSQDQRLMLAVVWYCGEVNNGGHEQFYSNSTGLLWRDAIAGFNKFGLPELAQLVGESAMRLGSPPLDRDERQKCLAEIAPSFEDLDERYVALEEELELDTKLIAYIRSHPSHFYLDVTIEG